VLAHRRGAAALSDPPPAAPPTSFLPGDEGSAATARPPEEASRLVARLTAGGARLGALAPERRLAAWRFALGTLLEPSSAPRRALDGTLTKALRLSPAGLQAGLEAIASGMLGASAEELFRAADRRPRAARRGPALVILASNLPGLALQTVLPALACGRALIVKSSQHEPCFAPALLRALSSAEPELASAFAALTWGHGAALESELLARCDPVLAYGGRDALDALRPRVAGRLVEYGAKLSIALVGADATAAEVGHLARDIALFDQRGCLSVQIALSFAPVERVAAGLAAGLDHEAELLPPGPATLEESAALRRELDLARLRGLAVTTARAGCVIAEPRGAALRPSPGQRCVRLHGVESIDDLGQLLAPLTGAIQGVALAGIPRGDVEALLTGLGVSRIAPCGTLQETDARWQNGGVDPVDVL
jgi:hypothetical protein